MGPACTSTVPGRCCCRRRSRDARTSPSTCTRTAGPRRWWAKQRVDDHAALDGAAAIFIYADGGKGHPALQGDRMKVIDGLAAKGVGLGFAHYGVEVPAGAPGDTMHRWLGGYLRDQLFREPDVVAGIRQVPVASRSREASGRSPTVTSGTSACAGSRTTRASRGSRRCSSRRRAMPCAAARTSARAVRTRTSSPPAARPRR